MLFLASASKRSIAYNSSLHKKVDGHKATGRQSRWKHVHKHCLGSVHAQMFAKPPVKRQCLCVRKHATTGSSVLAYLNPYTQSLMPFLVSVSPGGREHGRTSCRRTTWGAYSDTQFSCHSIIGAQRAWLAKTASEPPRPQITSAPAREIYMRRHTPAIHFHRRVCLLLLLLLAQMSMCVSRNFCKTVDAQLFVPARWIRFGWVTFGWSRNSQASIRMTR